MKVRTKENFTELRKVLIAGVVLCLLYGGLRFVETLIFDGNPVIGIGALAGGAALSLIFFCVYITFPHPTFFPLFTVTLSMVIFILLSIHMQAIDFHYFVMLLGTAFISSLKKPKLPLIFIAINIAATIIIFIFATLGRLPWLDTFRFFTQFALFLYGSFFIIWQTRNVERNENNLEKSMRTLKHREKMLAAINEMATRLLSHENKSFDDVMDRGLIPITAAAGIDRVAVYRYSDQYTRFGQVYLWIGKTAPLEEFMLKMPVEPPISLWHESFVNGECINANLKDLTEIEDAYLSRFGIKAIYFVPVFIHGKLWGVITLEDHTNYRYFDEDSLDLLQSAAHLCAGAVVREEMKNEIYNAKCDNKEKIRFLADISHEIRAPLTVIATGIDFADSRVEAGGDTAQIRNALDTVREETQRLGRMVGGMVNLAAMSDTDENRKRVDLAALLRNSAEVFRLTLEKQCNELNVDISPELPDVYVETDRFAQIMTNLFTNAARHTKDGRVTLTADYNETFITVQITDTGEGILPEILPLVFERGVSGGDGTGYGLHLCKTIVEAHGGTITADSDDTGTTITFTVPVYGGQEAGHKL